MKTAVGLLLLVGLIGCGGLRPFTLYEKQGKLMGTLPLVDQQVMYQAHYALAGLSQEAVVQRASEWLTGRYPGSTLARQVVPGEMSTLLATVQTRVKVKSANVWQASQYRLSYVLSINAKDSAYDVRLSGLSFYLPAVNVYTPARRLPVEAYTLGGEAHLVATFHAVDEAMEQTLMDLSTYVQQPLTK